jgi:hypothetical protein
MQPEVKWYEKQCTSHEIISRQHVEGVHKSILLSLCLRRVT